MNYFVNYNAFVSRADSQLPSSHLSVAINHFCSAFEEDYANPESEPELPGIHMTLRSLQSAPE